MAKTNDIKENFSALLRDSLRSRFGRIPSAAVFAREFNLRAYDTSPISQESARRWLRGVSLPEEARLRVLVNWLNLNFNDALKPGRIHSYKPAMEATAGSPKAASVTAASRIERFTGAPQANTADARKSPPNGSALSGQDAALLSAVFNLSEEQRAAILGLIAATDQPQLVSTSLRTSTDEPETHAPATATGSGEDALRSLRTRP